MNVPVPLMIHCLCAVSSHTNRYSLKAFHDLPDTVLQQLSYYLSAKELIRLEEIFQLKGVCANVPWKILYEFRWSFDLKNYKGIFGDHKQNIKQRYLQKHFHDVLTHLLHKAQSVYDPAVLLDIKYVCDRARKCTSRRSNFGVDSSKAPPQSTIEELYFYAQYVETLSVRGNNCSFLTDDKYLLDVLKRNTTILNIYHASDEHCEGIQKLILSLLNYGKLKQILFGELKVKDDNLQQLLKLCAGICVNIRIPEVLEYFMEDKGETVVEKNEKGQMRDEQNQETSGEFDIYSDLISDAVADELSCGYMGSQDSSPKVEPPNITKLSENVVKESEQCKEFKHTCNKGVQNVAFRSIPNKSFGKFLLEVLPHWHHLQKLALISSRIDESEPGDNVLSETLSKRIQSDRFRYLVIENCFGNINPGILLTCCSSNSNKVSGLETFIFRCNTFGASKQISEHSCLDSGWSPTSVFFKCLPFMDAVDASYLKVENFDLGSTIIDDLGVIQLCKYLESNKNLRRLTFGYNTISKQAMSSLMKSIAGAEQLQHLDFTGIVLHDKAELELVSFLPKIFNLKSLILEKCSLSNKLVSGKEFTDTVLSHPSLTELVLCGNGLGKGATKFLSEILHHKINSKSQLQILDLGTNQIPGKDLVKVAQDVMPHIIRNRKPLLQRLTLSNNLGLNESCDQIYNLYSRFVVELDNILTIGASETMGMAEYISQM